MVEMFRILLVNACALLLQDLKDQSKCESGLPTVTIHFCTVAAFARQKILGMGMRAEAALPSLEQHMLWEWALDPPAATLGTW